MTTFPGVSCFSHSEIKQTIWNFFVIKKFKAVVDCYEDDRIICCHEEGISETRICQRLKMF